MKNKKIDNNKKENTTTEQDNKRKYIIILIFILILLIVIGISYGKEIYKSIEEQVIEILDLGKPTSPVIIGGDKEWVKESLIKVEKDAETKEGIAYYEYCIREEKSTKDCEWKKTETKNVKIADTGKYYVTFRAVDKEERRGYNSNTEIVYIDNNNPVIKNIKEKEVTTNSIRVEVEASDNHSGIKNYYYSLDGKKYEIGKLDYTYLNLEQDKEYTIYIKVEDKVGNTTVLSMQLKTKKEEEKPIPTPVPTETPKPTETPVPTETPTPTETPVPTNTPKPTETPVPTNTPKPTETPVPTETPKPTETPVPTNTPKPTESPVPTETPTPTPTPTPKPPEVFDIPEINLDKVPSIITYGDSYELPSYVSFGKDTGTYNCIIEGKEYTDTSTIKIGKHLIVCTATSSHNIRVMIEKEIEVEMREGLDELFDGWIRLNLYFPEDSTDWKWRLGKEDEIRTGYNDDGWQDYTGPILVKLEDVENVYIKYKIKGVEYIIAPKGKVLIDIVPTNYTIKSTEKTKVNIIYDTKSTTKQYRINGGEWKEYQGEFEVESNTLIEAQASYEENVYTSEGNFAYKAARKGVDSVFVSEYISAGSGGSGGSSGGPGGGSGGSGGGSGPWEQGCVGTQCYTTPSDPKPPTYLEGPEIKVTPQTLTEEVTVEVLPQEEASKIYIRVGSGKYQEYTDQIKVESNELIRAYYIRKEDGKVSSTSYYEIDNIKVPSLPYVKITANPNRYLTENVEEVEVTISGTDYNKLEYSYDGIIYEAYTSPLIIKESKTVYAKGTNENGETIEEKTIVTVTPTVPKEEYDVSIHINPEETEVEGLINEVEVSIDYDIRATKKYYKLGWYGSWKEYTGPFKLKENTTVYAYCKSEAGSGETEKSVNYLTLGIAGPKINVSTKEPTQQVKVEIEYSKQAEIMRYQIGNGPMLDYTGAFYVYENTTITAYNSDVLGNGNTSRYTIKNIIVDPNYEQIDKGDYFIIKLNYPSGTEKGEYKWKSNGTWKSYDEKGILLIKGEYKDKILKDGVDGVKVEDKYGKEVIFTDNYYVLDIPVSEISENIFMRWDTRKPSKPTIIFTPDDSTREVEVSILYEKSIVEKYYKVVGPDGSDTGWKEYTGPIKVDQNNTVIYAKGTTQLEVKSDIASRKVTNIDEIPPEIYVQGDFTTPKQQVNITVNATDDQEVYLVKWEKGNKKIEYFKENGTSIPNNSSFKVTENGEYTIYAEDKVGNSIVKVIEITNIDKTAPNITIDVSTKKFGTTAEVSIDYGDSTKKQYKIGTNGTYKDYTDNITINSNDVLDLANKDKTLTIYAKGQDQAGNEQEISEIIYVLDLDAPKAPVINASAGYPILTEYGVKFDDVLTVAYDDRNDITNYISLDNGETWKVYTGVEHITSGTVKAKSVKNSSGLTTEASKNITQPADALGLKAYDGGETTVESMSGTIKRIEVSPEMQGKKLSLTANGSAYSAHTTIKFYDVFNNILKSQSLGGWGGWKGTNAPFDIPEGTKYIKFHSNVESGKINLYEIAQYNIPNIINKEYYPTLTEYGVTLGYSEVTIVYHATSVQRLYQIDDGEWQEYNDKAIKLKTGQKIQAKGIDKYGKETINIESYTSTLPSDALGINAYDGDETTVESMSGTIKRIDISPEMQGKKLSLTANGSAYSAHTTIKFYNAFDNILKSQSLGGWGGWKGTNAPFDIPEGTKYIKFHSNVESGKINLYEITSHDMPTISQTNTYPILSSNYFFNSKYKITINYLSYIDQKLYSLDNGTTWQEYIEPFEVNAGTVIKAKSIHNGSESSITTHTVTAIADELGVNAFDKDKTTYYTIAKNTTKVFNLSDDTYGKVLRVYTTSTPAANATLKIFDKDNNELLSTTLNKTVTVANIPENSYKVAVSSGSSALNVTEVNLREEIIANKGNPIIEIDNTNWSTSKTIDITYPEGYRNEYSLDLGETWQEYVSPITVDKNITVLARTVENDKVISSSSFTITKVVDYIGESILDYLGNNNASDGVYSIIANNEKYSLHTYIYDGNQKWSSDMIFGNEEDVAKADSNAKNMIVVKVNGDLIIEDGINITAYSSTYGGPKGFLLYIDGQLTNNGTITMTAKGAIAAGQNVYLLKNDDGTYEYIPAIGAPGSLSTTSGGDRGIDGLPGENGENRATGGGGGGANVYSSYASSTKLGGNGSSGTSYSGGSGGGGGNHGWPSIDNITSTNGGNCYGVNSGNLCQTGVGITTGIVNGNGTRQTNLGTGGLLIIYSTNLINNGKIEANGVSPAYISDIYAHGGASGGGSVNIFYNSMTNNGSITANGGTGVTGYFEKNRQSTSGNGGNGSVTTTLIKDRK